MIRQLFSQLAALAAVCTVTLMICPETEMKKYVRFACVLCAVSVVVSFLPFSKDLPVLDKSTADVADMTDKAAEMIVKETVSRLEDAVTELAYRRHGIDKDDITAVISYRRGDGGITELDGVNVTLKGLKYAVYTVSLKNEVKELFDIPCEVVISE